MSACINQASWDDGKLCGTCLRACWKETKECWHDGWNSAECEAAKAAGACPPLHMSAQLLVWGWRRLVLCRVMRRREGNSSG